MSELVSEKKKLFEEYNKVTTPLEGFSKEQLLSNPKVKLVLKVIREAEKDLKKDASNLFDEFNVKFVYTSSDNSKLSETLVNALNFSKDAEGNGWTISANFNFSKLCSLPAEEVYAVSYAVMNESLLKKKREVSGNKNYLFGKESEIDSETMTTDENFNRDGEYVRPSIFEYIKKILKLLLGDDEKSHDANEISYASNYDFSAVSKRISTNLESSGIASSDLFENPNNPNLVIERYGKLVKQGYLQQSTFLLGEISKDEFNMVKSNNENEVKSFCEKYVKLLLVNNGLSEKDIPITFEPVGSIGNFIDNGGVNQRVNINIQKIKTMKNPAEVIMTLSHELGHAFDSAENKLDDAMAGKSVKFGLRDNLVGNSKAGIESASDEDKKVYDYVVRLNTICYRINPNERSARQAELTAIKFMQGMNPDEVMQGYINTSIDSYNNYQTKVLTDLENALKMENEYNELKSLIRNQSTKDIIETRLGYIKSLNQREKLNPEQERIAINIALDAKKQLNAEKDIEGMSMGG